MKLHISDSSSAHHQEFIHCTLSNGIRHTEIYLVFLYWHVSFACLAFQYGIYHCWVHNEYIFDDGQRNCPKYAEFHAKINLRI